MEYYKGRIWGGGGGGEKTPKTGGLFPEKRHRFVFFTPKK